MKPSNKCMQTSLVIFNIFLFILGLIILGVGIWTAVDRVFLSDIIGTDLYSAASYLLMATGSIILVTAFIGAFGAITRMRALLITYFALLVLIFLCLVIAAIMAVVFRGELEDTMKNSMRETLLNYYGIQVHSNSQNLAVTSAWDETQLRFECCSVDDSIDWDYRVYRNSEWFKQTQEPQPPENQKFVPESCCRRVTVQGSQRYVDLDGCQKPVMPIPPRGDVSFGDNNAFNVKGCFSQGYNLVMDQAGILLGIGFSFALLLILGMVLSICMYRDLPNEETPVEEGEDEKL